MNSKFIKEPVVTGSRNLAGSGIDYSQKQVEAAIALLDAFGKKATDSYGALDRTIPINGVRRDSLSAQGTNGNYLPLSIGKSGQIYTQDYKDGSPIYRASAIIPNSSIQLNAAAASSFTLSTLTANATSSNIKVTRAAVSFTNASNNNCPLLIGLLKSTGNHSPSGGTTADSTNLLTGVTAPGADFRHRQGSAVGTPAAGVAIDNQTIMLRGNDAITAIFELGENPLNLSVNNAAYLQIYTPGGTVVSTVTWAVTWEYLLQNN